MNSGPDVTSDKLPLTRSHLLNLGGRTLEELNVTSSNELSMFAQSHISVFLSGEQYKGVSGRSAVDLMYEHYAILSFQNIYGLITRAEKLQLQNTRVANLE